MLASPASDLSSPASERVAVVIPALNEAESYRRRRRGIAAPSARGTKSRISNSRLHTMAKVGVFTRPTPITLRAPCDGLTLILRVPERRSE